MCVLIAENCGEAETWLFQVHPADVVKAQLKALREKDLATV